MLWSTMSRNISHEELIHAESIIEKQHDCDVSINKLVQVLLECFIINMLISSLVVIILKCLASLT